jgi:ubiquitin-protein ligase
VKREFLCRYETYLEVCEREKGRDGQAFIKAPFEYPANICEGSYNYAALIGRLKAIRAQLTAETEAWKAHGRELTARRAYLASTLRDEVPRLSAMGVNGGPISPDNMFVWNLIFMQPEGLYEEGMFTLEIVVPEDKAEYPRVTMLPTESIFHPTITASGIPWFHVPLDKKDSLAHIYKAINDLLTHQPSPSPATWVNTAAAQMCFARDPEQQKLFRRKARDLARRTVQ